MRLTYDRTLFAFTVTLLLTMKEMALDSCVRGELFSLDTRAGLIFDAEDDIVTVARFIDERYPINPLLSKLVDQHYAQVLMLVKMQQPAFFNSLVQIPLPENQFAFGGEAPNLVDVMLMHHAAKNGVELPALREAFDGYAPFVATQRAIGNDWY